MAAPVDGVARLSGGLGVSTAREIRRCVPGCHLAWFWARVKARTPKLAYFDGGFQSFADALAARVRSQGGDLQTNAPVESIQQAPDGGYLVQAAGRPAQHFDAVLSTTSPQLMQRLAPELPAGYLGQLAQLKSLGRGCAHRGAGSQADREHVLDQSAQERGHPLPGAGGSTPT
jgi:protoporphyrinogen oxidase